jgi:hypothetical protein
MLSNPPLNRKHDGSSHSDGAMSPTIQSKLMCRVTQTRAAVLCILPILLLPDRLAAADSVAASSARLPGTNLLVFHTRTGAVAPVHSKADWQRRRAEVLRGMEEVMGPLPGREKRCPLDLRIEQEADCGPYVRRLITYASEPGSRVPAYLLLPKQSLLGKQKRPAMLALHPTDMQYAIASSWSNCAPTTEPTGATWQSAAGARRVTCPGWRATAGA